MRLTFGPLPAAVYWRRRAVVLAGFALLVLFVTYAVASFDGSTAGYPARSGSPGPAAIGPVRPVGPSAAAPRSTQPSGDPAPAPVVTTATTCADHEIAVTASAASSQVSPHQSVDLTIRIKNVASRACTRDVGADHQELRLLDLDKIIWSSDDCGANSGDDMRTLAPGRELSFTLTWNGRRSRTGSGEIDCAAPAPKAATYQLVARLDQKFSLPFVLQVTTSA